MFFGLRRELRRVSIRLTLWHALLFLVSALTVLSLSYVVIRDRLVSQERDVIELRLNQYASEYERGGQPAVRQLASLRKGREQKAFFVRLADSANHTLFLRDADDWAEFTPVRLQARPPENNLQRGWISMDSPSGSSLLLHFVRLTDGSILEVGKSTEGLHNLLTGFRTAALVVLLIFLPASIAGGAFLASRALQPIQQLTAVTEQILATGNFDARVPDRGTDDELDALVQIFNQMLSRIDLLLRGMRDSLDNVAHDLRTPITRLRQKAQAALETDADLEATQDALAECIEESERVATLLNTLMDIAEAESGLVEFQCLPVEAAGLVRSAVESYTEVAEEKGVNVVSNVPSGWYLSGDANALRRVVVNLLDNAIKYTPAGGSVRIGAMQTPDSIMIFFRDTGCGIAAEDLPRIWDRLYRADKSRSERGLGLGLSFVRAIVKSHGGDVSISSEAGDGAIATIQIPSAEPPSDLVRQSGSN